MSGLSTVQQWRMEHIARCSCGSWLMLTHAQLTGDEPTTCPHVNPAAMEAAA